MKQTSVTDLKAHLSAVLRRVKRGESVVICERGHAIGTIVPAVPRGTGDAWVDRLVHEGRLVAAPEPGALPLDDARRPKPSGSVLEMLLREREEGR